MLVGAVDHSVGQQNLYSTETESRQAIDTVDKKDDDSKAKPQKLPGAANEPHDEYISGGDKTGETPGIYRLEKDENGQQKIVFDRPDTPEKSEQDGPEKSADKKHGLWCTVNTDRVDAEIKKLKEKKQQIEQQLKRTDDEDKCKELEKQFSQIELELSAKANDAYRKQHATYTYSAAR